MRRLIVMATLIAMGCSDTDDDGNNNTNNDSQTPLDEPFVIDDSQVSDLGSVQASPATTVEVDLDDITVVVPAGAVDSPVEITVGTLDEAVAPEGSVGDVFILGPDGTTFSTPIRLTFDVAIPSGTDVADLRPVQFDTGELSYRVLDNWAFIPGEGDSGTFVGETSHLSAYGVADAGDTAVTNDSATDHLAAANAALAARDLQAAKIAWEAALSADANSSEANFGSAITRLLLLPEHSAVGAVMTKCGEVAPDISGTLFGPDGFLSHIASARAGDAALTVTRQIGQGSASDQMFVANTVYAELDEDDLRVSANQHNNDNAGGGIEVEVDIDMTEYTWEDGLSIELTDDNRWMFDFWVDNSDSDDDSDSDGNYGYMSVDSGNVTVTTAGDAVGDDLVLTLTNIVVTKRDYQDQVMETWNISGTITDTLHESFEPTAEQFPFVDLEEDDGPPQRSEFIVLMEACGDGMGIPYLLEQLDLLMVEVESIAALLDVVATNSAFLWNVPVGMVANNVEIPVSAVEVNALRAGLYGLITLNEVAQHYHWMDADFDDVIGTYVYYDWDDDCYEGDCMDSTAIKDFDPELMLPHLNSDFLLQQAGANLDGADAALRSALQAAIDALSTVPAQGALFNFQAADAKEGSDELVAMAQMFLDSMDAEVAMRGSPNWSIHLGAFMDAPVTRTSIMTAHQDLAAMWVLEPRNHTEGEEENASLEPAEEVVEELLRGLMTPPDEPTTDIFCFGDDDECENVNPGWACNDELDDGSEICGIAEPEPMDEDKLETLGEGDPPPFVNEATFDAVVSGF